MDLPQPIPNAKPKFENKIATIPNGPSINHMHFPFIPFCTFAFVMHICFSIFIFPLFTIGLLCILHWSSFRKISMDDHSIPLFIYLHSYNTTQQQLDINWLK